jgi:hypothetical protein
MASAQPVGQSLTIYPTDMPLAPDPTLPQGSPWRSYFDSVAQRYFFVNPSTTPPTTTYEHPHPPVYSATDILVTDTTTPFLLPLMTATPPAAWLKLQPSGSVPYYYNSMSGVRSWYHPNPPPGPKGLTVSPESTLKAPFVKYMDPTSNRPFYTNETTKESRWDFPPSTNTGTATSGGKRVGRRTRPAKR